MTYQIGRLRNKSMVTRNTYEDVVVVKMTMEQDKEQVFPQQQCTILPD